MFDDEVQSLKVELDRIDKLSRQNQANLQYTNDASIRAKAMYETLREQAWMSKADVLHAAACRERLVRQCGVKLPEAHSAVEAAARENKDALKLQSRESISGGISIPEGNPAQLRRLSVASTASGEASPRSTQPSPKRPRIDSPERIAVAEPCIPLLTEMLSSTSKLRDSALVSYLINSKTQPVRFFERFTAGLDLTYEVFVIRQGVTNFQIYEDFKANPSIALRGVAAAAGSTQYRAFHKFGTRADLPFVSLDSGKSTLQSFEAWLCQPSDPSCLVFNRSDASRGDKVNPLLRGSSELSDLTEAVQAMIAGLGCEKGCGASVDRQAVFVSGELRTEFNVDGHDILVLQICGSSRLTFYPEECSSYFQVGNRARYSRVSPQEAAKDPTSPFAYLIPQSVHLEAGQICFIPANVWRDQTFLPGRSVCHYYSFSHCSHLVSCLGASRGNRISQLQAAADMLVESTGHVNSRGRFPIPVIDVSQTGKPENWPEESLSWQIAASHILRFGGKQLLLDFIAKARSLEST